MFKVYLGGPIRGLTFQESTSWRDEVTAQLLPEIVCYSPLRGKEEVLSGLPVLDGRTHPVDHPLTTGPGIVARDHYDVLTCDLLFVNLLGAISDSKGTIGEISWAFAYRKPIVLAMEDEGNIHEHPFVRWQASFVVPTLEQAVQITKAILLP